MTALVGASTTAASVVTRRAACSLLLQHQHPHCPQHLHPPFLAQPGLALASKRTLTFKAGDAQRVETPKDRVGNWTLPHPAYTPADMDKITVARHQATSTADHFASAVLFLFRKTFDLATRYPSHHGKFPPVKGARARPPDTNKLASELNKVRAESSEAKSVVDQARQQNNSQQEMELSVMRKQGLCFGPEAWLTRIVFLETIAGAPGLVAGMVRHLQSLRLMRRDKGWIATLLEEAENERMHLLTFLSYAEPGRFMRLMILLAQGVFTNAYFIAYLLAPRVAHRWIGYLEEEAVITYTRIIQDLDEGRLPEWENLAAPEIAISYWNLDKDAKMRDVLSAVRADESVHRFVNHSLANVGTDAMNPFAQALPPASVYATKSGFSKEEAEAWAETAAREAEETEVKSGGSSPAARPKDSI
ncbi:hypothetical protein V8E36_008911 [Tilletia maclaganii]